VEDPLIRHTHQIYNFLRFCELVVRFKTCKKITLATSYENEAQKESMEGPLRELAASLYVSTSFNTFLLTRSSTEIWH